MIQKEKGPGAPERVSGHCYLRRQLGCRLSIHLHRRLGLHVSVVRSPYAAAEPPEVLGGIAPLVDRGDGHVQVSGCGRVHLALEFVVLLRRLPEIPLFPWAENLSLEYAFLPESIPQIRIESALQCVDIMEKFR